MQKTFFSLAGLLPVIIGFTQNVGIGTTIPVVNLHVTANSSPGQVDGNILITNEISGHTIFDGLRIRMNSSTASIQNNENGDLHLQTNQGASGAYGSPAIWIKPSGAIGIGTSTPEAKLDVAGQIKITGGSPGAGKVLTSDANGLATWTAPASSSKWISNGNNIYNANSGRVGIGISSPAANLHVNDGVDGSLLITNDFTGYSLLDGLRLRMNSLVASIQNSENGDLFLSTNSGSAGAYGSPLIYIKPSGAVGVGTSNPGAKLEVAGQVKITGGSPGVGRVLTSDADGLATWAAPSGGSQWTTSGNNIYNNNSGFVGVGTNTPGHSLHVHHNGEGGLFDASIQLTNNWSGNAANDGLRIRIFNESTVSILNRENGDISFGTNSGATGAYGTPIFYVKPSGAMGIGTQNPDGKMEIKGVGSQTVLHLNEGFLKVSGTNKTAFTVTGTAENTSTYILTLNYANQSANDILLVTHNYNPGGVGGTYHNSATGVYWNGAAWNIYSDDQTTAMLGKSFNVLVIKQ